MELYFTDRKDWREWLEKHHSSEQEIWLIYYKKHSGKPRIAYNDAVEEALCFGWIDGKIKKINEDYYIQRFTPRRPGSRWSKYNIDRVRKLSNEGLMMPAGIKAYQVVLDEPDLIYENKSNGDPVIPDDLITALLNNPAAYDNFLSFPPSTRRLYIEWLNSARKAETRPRRIERIVSNALKNMRPGMM
jgi:uncharacterized protein YdeI (YjbR/CyaY-like superfamily)